MKNPLTLAGIEPATFRFVAQHLNHCATAYSTAEKLSGKRLEIVFKLWEMAISINSKRP